MVDGGLVQGVGQVTSQVRHILSLHQIHPRYLVLVASNSSVTVYEHDNIVLSCVETMINAPVVWMKNGEMISEQVRLTTLSVL